MFMSISIFYPEGKDLQRIYKYIHIYTYMYEIKASNQIIFNTNTTELSFPTRIQKNV